MQVFLTALTGLRAAAWAGDPSPAFGLDQPSLEIKISYQSGEQKRQAEIRFGKSNSGDQHYGMYTEEEGVFLGDDGQVNQLQALLTR